MSEAIVLTCKICGWDFPLHDGELIACCPGCGTAQSRPRVSQGAMIDLHRAHKQRCACDFTNAADSYQHVLRVHPDSAEALWGLALCKYGVEYVQDEKSGEHLPVVHFLNRRPITEDPDYLLAYAHAAPEDRPGYQHDAAYISRIQQDVLAAEGRGDAWDVFLCYKSSVPGAPDDHTREFAHAQELYIALRDAGYSVFFAHTTLRRAAGANYEAQVFHALQSARAMLVVVSDPAHLNTPWVHSEWTRYLERIDAGEPCRLIPLLYDGCDPYALPDAFLRRSIQGLTMGSLTALDDLRGILESCVAPKQTAQPEAPGTPQPVSPATEPLLRRAFLFLEDGDWQSADAYCEKVLDADPECARAYLGKLMAALHVTQQKKLRDLAQPFDGDLNYKRALRFADAALAKELQDAKAHIRERNENAAKEAAYRKAEQVLAAARTEQDFIAAKKQFEALSGWKDAAARAQECETKRKDWLYRQAENALAAAKAEQDFLAAKKLFETLGGWKDAAARAQECETKRKDWLYRQAENALAAAKAKQDFLAAKKQFEALGSWKDAANRAELCAEKAEEARKNAIYDKARLSMTNKPTETTLTEAIRMFQTIPGWKDADQRVETCRQKIKELKAKAMAEEEERKARAKAEAEERQRLLEARKQAARKIRRRIGIGTAVLAAVTALVLLVTQVIIPNSRYNAAVALMEAGQYEEAIAAFDALDGYRDSEAQIDSCNTAIQLEIIEGEYNAAVALMESSNYEAAIAAFEALGGYKDSQTQIVNCNTAIMEGKYNAAVALMENGDYEAAIAAFEAMDGYKDSEAQIDNCNAAIMEGKYNAAVVLMESGEHEAALTVFRALGNYRNSLAHIDRCSAAIYNTAIALQENRETALAAISFGKLGDYKDARSRSLELWDDIVFRNIISSGGNITVGLRADGTVVSRGNPDYDTSSWTDIVSVSAGELHTVGLRADGTVVAVGSDHFGQGDTSAWSDVVAIAAGYFHTVGLRADGTVVAVGWNDSGQCNTSAWSDIVAIAARGEHTVGLRADGTVVAVGWNKYSQCDTSAWSNIVAIAAGFYHTVGLRADGTVVAVGDNGPGRCDTSAWSDIVAIAAGWYHTVGLRADGTVVAVGSNAHGQCDTSAWTNIVAIAVGNGTYGLRANGTVVDVGQSHVLYSLQDWRLKTIPRPTLPK